jgi:hypothetical protein
MRDGRQIEIAADYSRHREDAPAGFRKVVCPATDHGPHPFRQRQSRAGDRLVEPAFSAQRPHQLVHEEWVPTRRPVNGRCDPLGNCPVGRLRDQCRNLALRKAAQRNGSGVASERGDAPANLRTLMRLDVAIGAEQDHASSGEITSQELQEQQRGFIRPLQVVEEYHERLDRRMRL